jgi:hypothetical protein
MNTHSALWRKFSMLVVLIMLVAVGCDEDLLGPTDPATPTPGPQSGTLTGRVVGTVNEDPLTGVRVTVQGKSATTDSNGRFTFSGITNGTLGVTVDESSKNYPRVMAVTVTSGNRSITVDAFEKGGAFNLKFYQELARGNHPNERNIYQTHRWTNSTPPTFYIDTEASATADGKIDDNQIQRVKNVIRQIVPVFTGNFYPSSVTIKTKDFYSLAFGVDVPANTYVISFDDTLMAQEAFGITETDPDFVSPDTSSINRTIVRLVDDMSFYTRGGITFEEVVAHEMGHGFGYRHTSTLYLRSVMVAIGEFGGLYSEADQLYMRIMYSRPAGNRDIDIDPVPGAKLTGEPIGRQIFVDRLAHPIALTAEERERLQALPNKLPQDVLNMLQQR